MPRRRKASNGYTDGFAERQAGRMRLPRWAVYLQLSLILVFLQTIALGWIFGFAGLHVAIHGATLLNTNSWAEALVMISALPSSILLSLNFTNVVLWLVPAARRANEKAFEGVKGGSFRQATGWLVRVALFAVPICVLLALLGAWSPWVR